MAASVVGTLDKGNEDLNYLKLLSRGGLTGLTIPSTDLTNKTTVLSFWSKQLKNNSEEFHF